MTSNDFIEVLLENPIQATLKDCSPGDICLMKGYGNTITVLDTKPSLSGFSGTVLCHSPTFGWVGSFYGKPSILMDEKAEQNIDSQGLDKNDKFYYYEGDMSCTVVGRRVLKSSLEKSTAKTIASSPIAKTTLKVGDRFRATIGIGNSNLTTTGMVVSIGMDAVAHLDCSFDFGDRFNETISIKGFSESVKLSAKELGFEPSDNAYYWISRDHVVINEIISSKQETKSTEATATAPVEQETKSEVKVEPATKPTPKSTSTIDINSLRIGERVRANFGGIVNEGMFLGLTTEHPRAIITNDSKNECEGYIKNNSTYFRNDTFTRLVAAQQELNITQSQVLVIEDTGSIERVDIGPATLDIGDVVEIEWLNKRYETIVVAKPTTSKYEVVFYCNENNLFTPYYGVAKRNIQAMGLQKEVREDDRCVVGWNSREDVSRVPTVKRLIQKGSYKLPSSEITETKPADKVMVEEVVKPAVKDVPEATTEAPSKNQDTLGTILMGVGAIFGAMLSVPKQPNTARVEEVEPTEIDDEVLTEEEASRVG